jgi:hypothetical protein
LQGPSGRDADCSVACLPKTKGPVSGPFPFIFLSVSVKQLFEERFLPLGMTMPMAVPVRLSVASIVALIILRLRKGGLLHWSAGWCVFRAAFEDLVEFSSIEPNPTTLWAIVNLDTLSLTHNERNLTHGTWHTGGASHKAGLLRLITG